MVLFIVTWANAVVVWGQMISDDETEAGRESELECLAFDLVVVSDCWAHLSKDLHLLSIDHSIGMY